MSDVPKQLTPWQPGQSGNPAGKPKGSRNKLAERFIDDLYVDWKESGKEAIQKMRAEKPAEYVKVVASLMPKQIEIKENAFDGLTDDQLSALVAAAKNALGIGDDGSGGTQPTIN